MVGQLGINILDRPIGKIILTACSKQSIILDPSNSQDNCQERIFILDCRIRQDNSRCSKVLSLTLMGKIIVTACPEKRNILEYFYAKYIILDRLSIKQDNSHCLSLKYYP